jgi:hypothetical protein
LLSSETIAPKTNKSLTTTYEYDRFGNKTKSTTTGSGINVSSTTIKYSADGKFPIKTIRFHIGYLVVRFLPIDNEL